MYCLLVCSYKLTSLDFLHECCHARSIPIQILKHHPQGVPSETRGMLGKLLDSNDSLNVAHLTVGEREAVHFLYTRGVIIPLESDAMEETYHFATPLHEFVLAYYFYRVDVEIQTFDALISMLIRRLSPTALAQSAGRTPRTGNPLEGTYHHAAYHALMGLLPRDANKMKAVASSFVGKVCACIGDFPGSAAFLCFCYALLYRAGTSDRVTLLVCVLLLQAPLGRYF